MVKDFQVATILWCWQQASAAYALKTAREKITRILSRLLVERLLLADFCLRRRQLWVQTAGLPDGRLLTITHWKVF